jgi:NADPH-dependent F420 reductase
MRLALLGGTGDIGEGLALRWARDTDHDLVIGSRNAAKATRQADEYEAELTERGIEASISAGANDEAVKGADVVVLSVPPYYVTDTLEAVAETLPSDAVVVSPAVGIDTDEDGFHNDPPGVGSVTQLAAETVDNRVVGAFHNLPADRLSDLDADLGMDTLVVGSEDAKGLVASLADEIEGLRALDGGPLANAPEIEGLTPLLINVARYNDGLSHLGVRFT